MQIWFIDKQIYVSVLTQKLPLLSNSQLYSLKTMERISILLGEKKNHLSFLSFSGIKLESLYHSTVNISI